MFVNVGLVRGRVVAGGTFKGPDVFVHGLLVVPQPVLGDGRVFALVTRKLPDLLRVDVLLVPFQLRREDGRVVAQVAPEVSHHAVARVHVRLEAGLAFEVALLLTRSDRSYEIHCL